MGGSQRLAAAAAVSHSRHYYNNTHPEVVHNDTAQYGVNVFFISATLCGVLVAVCAACWPRSSPPDKPEEAPRGVYTISEEAPPVQITQMPEEPGPPPAYETVVTDPDCKDSVLLQEVVTEPCRCSIVVARPDSGLPSYEAAVMLKDTKL